jgi:hypothetical protein
MMCSSQPLKDSSPLDTDTQRDYYDARIDGGFRARGQSVGPCEGEACQGASAPPPIFGAPASSTFEGPGNLTPAAVPVMVKTVAQIRAQKLAKALKACRAKHDEKKRVACERAARKKYGPAKKAKGKAKRSRR